jgi:hypothetical protein
LATRRSATELLLRWRHRLESHQRVPGCNRVPESSATVPGLRRRASNPRRRWLTATRSSAELLRKMCALDHVMPLGERMPAFLLCFPPQALHPQDGPGYASPADGDPCRTRTCVRCVRGSRPTAGRTGRELERKVEVSNPHGRAVSLFSKQGAPSQRGIPSRAEGQRIERWRGRPRPSLSKRAPFLSVNPPMRQSARMFCPDSAPGSIRTSILRCRRPLRVQSRHGGSGTCIGPKPPPGADPGPQPYQGCALPTELWRRSLVDWTRTSGLCLRRAALLSN